MSYVIVDPPGEFAGETPTDVSMGIPQTTLDVTQRRIEIPEYFVEYIGKIMCGEIARTPDGRRKTDEDVYSNVIVEATVVDIDNIVKVRTPYGMQERESTRVEFAYETPNELPEKCQTITHTTLDSYPEIPYKDTSFRDIYNTHIHICECIAVISCCIAR